jgi:hypothetical protein
MPLLNACNDLSRGQAQLTLRMFKCLLAWRITSGRNRPLQFCDIIMKLPFRKEIWGLSVLLGLTSSFILMDEQQTHAHCRVYHPHHCSAGKVLETFLVDVPADVLQARTISKTWEYLTSYLDKGLLPPSLREYVTYLDIEGRRRGYSKLPANVSVVLKPFFGDISLSRVRYAQEVNTLHGKAITVGYNIYFPRRVDLDSCKESRCDFALLIHELEHVSQYKKHGGVEPFLLKYVGNGLLQSPFIPLSLIQGGAYDLHAELQLEKDANAKVDNIFDTAWPKVSQKRIADPSPTLIMRNYGQSAGGWRVDRHPRITGDVNGDGVDDIVGFGDQGAYLSLGNDRGGLMTPIMVVPEIGYGHGWRDNHPRFLGDINGDGKSDIIGFADSGVIVSFSKGNSFEKPKLLLSNYGAQAGGWSQERHPRLLADIDGDGKVDIVGFGNAGVIVAFSTGRSFTPPKLLVHDFGYTRGSWRIENHPRMTADVNGDGRADIVGFGNAGVIVALSKGRSFHKPKLLVNNFGHSAGGWRTSQHPRMLGDINGDGKDDIVGFANKGIIVAFSEGSKFQPPKLLFKGMTAGQGGWRVDRHPRLLADTNGDKKADIIGFGNDSVFLLQSKGTSFSSAKRISPHFGYNAGNWRVDRHPRTVADMNGDGKDDIVGFGDSGVFVTYN